MLVFGKGSSQVFYLIQTTSHTLQSMSRSPTGPATAVYVTMKASMQYYITLTMAAMILDHHACFKTAT